MEQKNMEIKTTGYNVCKRKNQRKVDQILRQDFLAIILIPFFDSVDAISFVD
jgi:hypothetical protein